MADYFQQSVKNYKNFELKLMGSNVFEIFGTYQMGLPPSDLLLMTFNIEHLIFITILAERNVH